jgi:hypothetical protein
VEPGRAYLCFSRTRRAHTRRKVRYSGRRRCVDIDKVQERPKMGFVGAADLVPSQRRCLRSGPVALSLQIPQSCKLNSLIEFFVSVYHLAE